MENQNNEINGRNNELLYTTMNTASWNDLTVIHLAHRYDLTIDFIIQTVRFFNKTLQYNVVKEF